MKNQIKVSVLFLLIFCFFTNILADIGIGISDVGSISSVTGIEDENTTPAGYCLNQNYPNPFNPVTTFIFNLPQSAFVSLKIYNISGQMVETVIKENLPAGNHLYKWDAGNLPSGIYFYKLETDNFQQVNKMILLK